MWRGTLNAAIPKPAKDGSRLQFWRSVALAEAAFKGVGKALPGQNGALQGQQIGRPAHHVQAHLQVALQQGRSTAVIFLDGRSAYYATIRDFLFCHDLADLASLEELMALLMPDEELRDQGIASLLGPGLLQQSGLGASLEDYLRGNLKATLFTMETFSTLLQHTLSGAAPGSSLADLLYQFVQSQFMRGVMNAMAHESLCVRLHATSDPVHPQGRADDVAVLLPSCDATDLERRESTHGGQS